MKKEYKLGIIAFLIYMFFIFFFFVSYCVETGEYKYMLILFILSILGCIKIIIKYKEKYKLKYDKIPKLEKWTETDFNNIEPIYAGYLLKRQRVNINGVIATLFILEKKGIISIDIIGDKYKLSVNNNLTYQQFEQLEFYEKKIFKIFFKNTNNKEQIDLEECIKKFDKNYEYKVALNDLYKEIEMRVNNAFFEKPFLNLDSSLDVFIEGMHVTNVIFGTLIVIIGLGDASGKITLLNLILYMISIILIIYMNREKHIKSEYYEEINELYGLYNYIMNQDRIPNMELKEVKLYEKFLLYAISMGIADKIEKQFNQEELNSKFKLNIQLLFGKREKKDG